MENQDYFGKLKEIQSKLLNFLENDDNEEENFLDIKEFFNNIQEDNDELNQILHMISKISQNHNRQLNFFAKIEKILLELKEKITKNYDDLQIYDFFKKDIRILLFLFESKIISINKINVNDFINGRYRIKRDNFAQYFYKEIKSIIDENLSNNIAKRIPNIDETFDKKRKIGENDNEICEIIRNDKIEEFIIYVNKNIIPLQSTVPESIFETNRYLIRHKPKLIEYAAFYGSNQIIKYLFKNNVEASPPLWIYAMHGNDPELINFLQENKIVPFGNTYILCYKEAIKCHHNEMAEYIKINFLNNDIYDFKREYRYELNIVSFHLKYYNFINMPSDFTDYRYKFIDVLLEQEGIEIPTKTFQKSEITTIKIPKIKCIDTCTFTGCVNLKEVVIPDSVTSIKKNAFYGCISLKTINLPSTLVEIESSVFNGCSSLEKITIPPLVKKIGISCFKECTSLIEIRIDSNITEICNNTFFECSSLSKIIFKNPSKITAIGNSAFGKCVLLKEIDLSSVKKFGTFAFFKCKSLKKIELFDSLNKIPNGLFKECTSLTHVSIPHSVVHIGTEAFCSCSSLEEIILPQYLMVIDQRAFCGCTSLKEIKIPPHLTEVENDVIHDCTSLKTVYIPKMSIFGLNQVSSDIEIIRY